MLTIDVCRSEHLARVHGYSDKATAEPDDETNPTLMSKAMHDRWWKKWKEGPRPEESNGNVPIGNAMKIWRALNLTEMPHDRTWTIAAANHLVSSL